MLNKQIENPNPAIILWGVSISPYVRVNGCLNPRINGEELKCIDLLKSA
jgi:hypothetical protein